MKMILSILILVAETSASGNSVYNWHVRTIDGNSNMGDAIQVEKGLHNEQEQKDPLQNSRESNNIEYYPNSYYISFAKNANDIKDEMKYFLKDKTYNIYDEKSNLQSSFDNNYTPKQGQNIFLRTNPSAMSDNLNKYKDSYHDRNNKVYKNVASQNNYNLEEPIKSVDVRQKQLLNKSDNNSIETELKVGKHLDINNFVGTNLFESTAKKCFSSEDVALLVTRKDFETLIPKDLPQCLFDDHIVGLLLNYFSICHQMVIRTTSVGSRHLAQKAFYDTFGGYLNFYMVPVTKYSYYAGKISLNTAQQILTMHQETKKFLNTNGNGWRAPLQNVLVELKSIYIEPLYIESTLNESSVCMQLTLNKDENHLDNDKMIVELPKSEAENKSGLLSYIRLPFKGNNFFDVRSESSAYMLVKFYETVTKCYRSENIDQEIYNEQFSVWLWEIINKHLSDEAFYPGLGAVLRIYEYLKRRKKGFIEIGADLRVLGNKNEEISKFMNHKIRSMHLSNKSKIKSNETKEERRGLKIDSLKNLDRNNIELTKDAVGQQTSRLVEKDNIGEPVYKRILSTLHVTSYQMAVIATFIATVILLVTICCCKYCCKKKKSETQVEHKKNSSSSSSTLFTSPVRFFHIRKKSTSGNTTVDNSSNAPGNKKNKKSVKIEKLRINSESSTSNSPVRNKKPKEKTNKKKGKNKDSGKSNSKSSWETTYSSAYTL